MDELVEGLEDLQSFIDKLDDFASIAGFPAPLMEAKEALEEAIGKIEDYVNAG